MLARMQVGTKILGGFAIAIAVAAAVGAVSYAGARKVVAQLEDVVANDAPALVALGNVTEGEGLASASLNALFLTELGPDDPGRKAAHEAYEAGLKEIEESTVAFEKTTQDQVVTRPWQEAQRLLVAWMQSSRAARAAIQEWEQARRAGRPDADAAYRRAWSAYALQRAALGPAQKAVDGVQEIQQADVRETRTKVEALSSSVLAQILVGGAVGALALLALGLYLARGVGTALRGLGGEAAKLTAAVKRGELSVRGDAAAVHPEFQPIVHGMNATMDAYARPLAVTLDHVERISKGDIPEPIREEFQGDFQRIRDALNRCIGTVNGLVGDVKGLVGAAQEGQLSARADASRHAGEFRAIVEGMNGTLDAVLAPIDEASRVLEGLARRDLCARVEGDYRGQHARIKQALNATAEALQGAMSQVASAADQVSSAAGQIASSSQAVAQGASEQASSLEETSSSLESMTSSTRQAADSAQAASGLAGAARASAGEGAEAVGHLSSAMEKIRASAESTSQIIKDINEIAFQTNLLALNAAVEAARAGAAGRGFAVVAEEVRSLALRSKEAANKTEGLIRESVRQAGEGEASSQLVSGKLRDIVGAIAKVTDIVTELAASAKEQAAGIDQVTKAVTQMSQVTQQNAASSEEASSSAQELAAQSQDLGALVATFQLERARAAAGSAAHGAGPGGRAGSPPPPPGRNGQDRSARNGRAGQGQAVSFGDF